MKKICYIGNARCIHTVRWAQHFKKMGYDVTIISHYSANIDGIKVIESDCSLVRFPVSILKIRKIINEIDPDIVHAHQVLSEGLYAAFSGRRYVVSAWGSDVLLGPSESRILKLLAKIVIHGADYITSVNDIVTEKLIELGADKCKVSTFPMGISKENYEKLINVNKNKDIVTIVSPRNLKEIYNVDVIIKAFKIIADKFDNVRLVITGDGPELKRLRDLTNECGINRSVEFKGFMQHDEFIDLLSEADIMVSVPVSDGASVALAEGMAAKDFPIVSDLPSNRAFIKDGVNGYIVKKINAESVAEALSRAINSNDLVKKAVEYNRNFISEKGIWEKNISVVDDYYNTGLIGNTI